MFARHIKTDDELDTYSKTTPSTILFLQGPSRQRVCLIYDNGCKEKDLGNLLTSKESLPFLILFSDHTIEQDCQFYNELKDKVGCFIPLTIDQELMKQAQILKDLRIKANSIKRSFNTIEAQIQEARKDRDAFSANKYYLACAKKLREQRDFFFEKKTSAVQSLCRILIGAIYFLDQLIPFIEQRSANVPNKNLLEELILEQGHELLVKIETAYRMVIGFQNFEPISVILRMRA